MKSKSCCCFFSGESVFTVNLNKQSDFKKTERILKHIGEPVSALVLISGGKA
jgi:hypothetical protein